MSQSKTRHEVFLVDKPIGLTSRQVVDHFKKNLPRPLGKIGHLGTLDPNASGLLLVATGKAPRLNELLGSETKTYWVRGQLGISSPTGDLDYSGEFTKDPQFENLQLDQFIIEGELTSFLGEYWQRPPAYSACKHEGKALYQWAREGKAIVKEPVQRFVSSFSDFKWERPFVEFKVTVSSGTYIRTLFTDLAEKLGTIGLLSELRRLSIGDLHVDTAITEDQWPKEGLAPRGLSLEKILPLGEEDLSNDEVVRFLNGNPVPRIGEGLRWAFYEGELVALGEMRQNLLWPKIVLKD